MQSLWFSLSMLLTGCAARLPSLTAAPPPKSVVLAGPERKVVELAVISRLNVPESTKFGPINAGKTDTGAYIICGWVQINAKLGKSNFEPFEAIYSPTNQTASMMVREPEGMEMLSVKTRCYEAGVSLPMMGEPETPER